MARWILDTPVAGTRQVPEPVTLTEIRVLGVTVTSPRFSNQTEGLGSITYAIGYLDDGFVENKRTEASLNKQELMAFVNEPVAGPTFRDALEDAALTFLADRGDIGSGTIT